MVIAKMTELLNEVDVQVSYFLRITNNAERSRIRTPDMIMEHARSPTNFFANSTVKIARLTIA